MLLLFHIVLSSAFVCDLNCIYLFMLQLTSLSHLQAATETDADVGSSALAQQKSHSSKLDVPVGHADSDADRADELTLSQAMEEIMDNMFTDSESHILPAGKKDPVDGGDYIKPSSSSSSAQGKRDGDSTSCFSNPNPSSDLKTPEFGSPASVGQSTVKTTRKRQLSKTVSSPGSVRSCKSHKSLSQQNSFSSVPEFGQNGCPHADVCEEFAEQDVPVSECEPQGSASEVPCVKSLSDAMKWPTHHTNCVTERLRSQPASYQDLDSDSDSDTDANAPGSGPSVELKRMLKAFDAVPMSTAFSGIDAPGTSMCQQISELNSRVTENSKIGKPVHLNGVEWFGPSQDELLDHPCKPQCLFGDITQFLSPYLRGLFPELVKKNKLMEVFKPIVCDPTNNSVRLTFV